MDTREEEQHAGSYPRIQGVVLVWLAACAHRVESGLDPEVAAAIEQGDAAWARRAEPGQRDAAVAAWQGALPSAPREPELLWRISRAEWARGVLEPDSTEPFESGLDLGWRCLMGFAGFSSTLELGGYRVEPRAVDTLPAEAAGCVAWVIVNGVALEERRGAGAALVLEPLRTLVPVLRAHPETAPGFGPWAEARLGLADAPPLADTAARALFREAIAAAPGVALFRRDYTAVFPDARDVAWAGWVPDASWAAENAAWE